MRNVLAAIVLCAALSECNGNGITRGTHDEITDNRFEYEGSGYWRFSTVVDTHTGIVYLVFDERDGSSSVGGITALLDKDGKPVTDPRYGDEE